MRSRLSGRRRFAAVRAARNRVSVGSLRVNVAPNGLEEPRVGFVLREMRNAVARNRLRRRLRAALRPRLADLGGLDIIVTGTPRSSSASFAELEGDLKQCLAALMGRRALQAEVTRPRDPLCPSQ